MPSAKEDVVTVANPPDKVALPKGEPPSQKATVPVAEGGKVAVNVTGDPRKLTREPTGDGITLEANDTVEAVVAVAVNGSAPVVGVVVLMMG